jgi:hypothetical protein
MPAAPGSFPVTPDHLCHLPPAWRGLRVFALPGGAQGVQQFLTLLLKEWVRLVRELHHSCQSIWMWPIESFDRS